MDRDNSFVVVDTIYYEEEGNRIYSGSYEQCLEFLAESGGIGMEIVPNTKNINNNNHRGI